jgi:hypothetical protein
MLRSNVCASGEHCLSVFHKLYVEANSCQINDKYMPSASIISDYICGHFGKCAKLKTQMT